MSHLKVASILVLLVVANCSPIKNEDDRNRAKRQLFEALAPDSKLYSVFNSDNPDDSLTKKFLGNDQPIFIQTLGGYNFYFPLMEDDEDYGDDARHVDYAEEDDSNDETVSNDPNESSEVVVVEAAKISNYPGMNFPYKAAESSNEAFKMNNKLEETVFLKGMLDSLTNFDSKISSVSPRSVEKDEKNTETKSPEDLVNTLDVTTVKQDEDKNSSKTQVDTSKGGGGNSTSNQTDGEAIFVSKIAQNNSPKQDEANIITKESESPLILTKGTDPIKLSEDSNVQNQSSSPLQDLKPHDTKTDSDGLDRRNSTSKTNDNIATATKTEDMEKNMTLFLSNLLQNVTSQKASNVETGDLFANPKNVTFFEVLQKLCRSLNESSTAPNEITADNNRFRSNNRPQFGKKDVTTQPTASDWAGMLLREMFSSLMKKSSLGIASTNGASRSAKQLRNRRGFLDNTLFDKN